MVRAFAKSGDREGLVTLLSRRFPNGTIVPYELIEFYLACSGKKTLKDRFLFWARRRRNVASPRLAATFRLPFAPASPVRAFAERMMMSSSRTP